MNSQFRARISERILKVRRKINPDAEDFIDSERELFFSELEGLLKLHPSLYENNRFNDFFVSEVVAHILTNLGYEKEADTYIRSYANPREEIEAELERAALIAHFR